MATYEEAWTKGGDALSKKYGGDKSKFIAAAKAYNTKKYGTTEPTRDGKKKATETANNERIASVVNRTNQKANGGAGALPQKGSVMNKDKSGNVITNKSLPGGGSRAVIEKAGTKGAKKAENSTVRSSSSNPNTEYGKFKKSMEGSGKQTHRGMTRGGGDGNLKTGMGTSTTKTKNSGKEKTKVYNKAGDKVAVVKKSASGKDRMRLTKAGRKDEDTTITKTKKDKSGTVTTKTKGAPKAKAPKAKEIASRALGVGTKNPDGSAKEVKGSAVRKKTREVRSQKRNIKNQKY